MNQHAVACEGCLDGARAPDQGDPHLCCVPSPPIVRRPPGACRARPPRHAMVRRELYRPPPIGGRPPSLPPDLSRPAPEHRRDRWRADPGRLYGFVGALLHLLRRFTPRMGPRQTAIIMDSRLMCRFGAVSFVVSWVRGSAETFPGPEVPRDSCLVSARRETKRHDFSYRWVVVAIGDVEYRHGIWPAGRRLDIRHLQQL